MRARRLCQEEPFPDRTEAGYDFVGGFPPESPSTSNVMKKRKLIILTGLGDAYNGITDFTIMPGPNPYSNGTCGPHGTHVSGIVAANSTAPGPIFTGIHSILLPEVPTPS